MKIKLKLEELVEGFCTHHNISIDDIEMVEMLIWDGLDGCSMKHTLDVSFNPDFHCHKLNMLRFKKEENINGK